jgi:hypothetical protein
LELGERIELLRKTVSGILFVLLLASMFTAAFKIQVRSVDASLPSRSSSINSDPSALVPIVGTFTTVMSSNTTSWDATAIATPFVLFDSQAGLYKMWYWAMSNPVYIPPYYVYRHVIAYAESRDGVTWTNKTVVQDTGSGTYYITGAPWVLEENGTYLMWHMGWYEWVGADWSEYIARMSSSDGVNWPAFQSPGDQKVLSAQGQSNPEGDGRSVSEPWIIHTPGQGYTMWYSVYDYPATGTVGPQKIWTTTSADGVSWSNRQLSLPYVPSSWEANVAHPSVVKEDDGTYTIYYAAASANGSSSIGVAQSLDGISWTNRTQLLKPSDLSANITYISDPSCFQDVDGKRYLYFTYYDGKYKFGRILLGEPSGPPGVQWSRTYGGAGDECAFSIVQTMDGGYALGGCTNSYGAGGYDFWLVKTDAAGNVQWNRTYGTPDDDWCYSIIQTSDGGYALAGLSNYGGFHGLLVKTDEFGNMLWSKTYVGPYPGGASLLYSVVQTCDGGYAMAGYAYTGAGLYGFWLVKTDASGNVQWSNTYGGAGNDIAYSVIQTNDGGYALAGYTTSYGAGKADFYLVKTYPNGTLQGWMAYGGAGDDIAHSVIQTNDGGYALAGYTDSYGSGGTDGLLIKTDEFGHMEWNNTYGGAQDDHVYSVVQTPDGRYLMAGDTFSYGAGDYDCWFVTVNENGTMLWNMTFGGAGPEFACSVTLTSDGGYIAYGESKPSGPGPYDTIAVKYKPKVYDLEKKKIGPEIEKLNQHRSSALYGDQYCVPTSAAACLAWFAEKDRKKYGSLIPDANGNGQIDQFDKYGVALVLGSNYMFTDQDGTTARDFIKGLEEYIEEHGLGGKFTVTPIWNPSYQRVKDEFKKGQDVLVGIRDGGVGHFVVLRGMNENPNPDGSYDVSFMNPWTGNFIDSHWTPKAGPDFDELSQPDCNLDGNLSTIPKVQLVVSVCPQGDPPYNQTLTGYAVESNGHTYVITGTDFNEVYVVNGTVYGVIGGTVYNTTGTVYGFANRTVGIVNGTYFPVTGSAYIINGSQAQNNPSIPLHDVELTDVQPFKTVVGAGFNLSINVTVDNGGNQNETFFVTAYANATLHQRKTVTLTSGNFTTITFMWNTTGFAKGNYTIGAYAWPVEGEKETDTADNWLTGGWVVVTWQGDLTDENHLTPPGGVSDGKVDENDLWYFCAAFINYYKIPSRLDPNCDFNNDGKIDEDDLWYGMCTGFINYWKQH